MKNEKDDDYLFFSGFNYRVCNNVALSADEQHTTQ